MDLMDVGFSRRGSPIFFIPEPAGDAVAGSIETILLYSFMNPNISSDLLIRIECFQVSLKDNRRFRDFRPDEIFRKEMA